MQPFQPQKKQSLSPKSSTQSISIVDSCMRSKSTSHKPQSKNINHTRIEIHLNKTNSIDSSPSPCNNKSQINNKENNNSNSNSNSNGNNINSMEIDKEYSIECSETSIFPILPIEINITNRVQSQSISTSNQYIPSTSPIIINNENNYNNQNNNSTDYEIIDYEPSPAPSPPYPIDTLFIQQIQNMRGGRFTSYPTHIMHCWLRSVNQS